MDLILGKMWNTLKKWALGQGQRPAAGLAGTSLLGELSRNWGPRN